MPAQDPQDPGRHVATATVMMTITTIKNQCPFNSNVPVTSISDNLLGKSTVTIRQVLILRGSPVSWPARPLGLRTWQEVSTSSLGEDGRGHTGPTACSQKLACGGKAFRQVTRTMSLSRPPLPLPSQ